ncbi:phage portal protein [Paenibacillus thiaminolyticus]|nr:phage portal protein [Paenibacillus thiaminolyticus]
MKNIERILREGAMSEANLNQIIQIEIGDWLKSKKREWMLTGERYYRNETDILERVRTAIGASGAKEPVGNLANNKLPNAFTRKLVDQKVGYLLGKPMSIQTKNKDYHSKLTEIFNDAMLRRIQSIGEEAINKGIAWLHPYYDETGMLCFKKMKSEEIIPLWRDEEHTELQAIIRVYDVIVYEGLNRTTVTKVEWWDTEGVRRYVLQNGLVPDVEAGEVGSHFTLVAGGVESEMNWERVPFIAWKYNSREQPLVEIIKGLIDDYDKKKSDNSNNLEDLPNSTYVVTNYDGTDAAEFRKNISTYRVVFVSNEGGVDSVNIEIDTEAYKTHQEQNRKDIYEFGRGVDTQMASFGSAPSGKALRFLYSDLDLDANKIETEFQASLEQLLWFINAHLYNTTRVDYSNESVEFVFNRDMPIDESEIIDNINKSSGVLSEETLVAQHPWTKDVREELKRRENEAKKAEARFEQYNFPKGDETSPKGEEE